MPAPGDFGGLGQRHTPVRLVPNADWAAARLSAEEGFVLSRVDGFSNLETLCLLSGLGRQATCTILGRLAGLGLIRIGEGTGPAAGAGGISTFRPARPVTPTPEPEPIPVIPLEGELPPDEQTVRQAAPAAAAAAAAACDLLPDEPDLDLKPEARAAIRALHARLQEMTFFQLLDIEPSADATAVRRAYFKRSKEFHPDRYFRKRMGSYKPMLDEIFKQMSAAYHFLEDDSQRASYRDMVVQEMADAAALAQVEAQGAEAAEAAASDDYPVPELAEVVPRPERRRSGLFRPRFPWSVGKPTPAPAPSVPEPPRELSPEEQAAREQRRQEDRRRRFRTLSNPALERPRQGRQFYDQGMRQLAAGQSLVAAASLKLALTFGGDDPEYQRAYQEAVDRSRAQMGENCYRRGVFEESVGRLETAHRYFIQAADALPKVPYLCKAAEVLLAARDLITARNYATRAVQTDPKSVDARVVLAKIFEAAGMSKNARRELEEALKLEPGSEAATDLLRSLQG